MPPSGRDGGVHVVQNLRGAQGPVINPHLVDQSLEVLAPNTVSADMQYAICRRDGPGLRAAGDQHAIHIKSFGCAVIGEGQVGPRVHRRTSSAQHLLLRRSENAGYRSSAVSRPIEEVSAVRGHFLKYNGLPSLRRG